VIAGGTEAVVHPLPIAAFAAMQALSKRNDSPATASRPYDISRDGFVLGEGAATIVLETEEHALARGAKIYAELAGGAVTSDSYHITAPDPEGNAAARAMRAAIAQAGAKPEDVAHINAHATSTPVGDIAEYRALLRIFGDYLPHIPVSATKAATGHLLGGTGALEAIFTILALHERTAPPTINLENQDPEIPLDVVTKPRALGSGSLLAISNSFGFGGHNAVAAFRSYN
jgi:3-oxoacyl-[acyl-carrier-protein] synthase II